jgi:tetratricopeptide (TPR) repeat protein
MVKKAAPALLVAVVVASILGSARAAGLPQPTFDKSKFSQEPTACDVLAAHPDDPNRVAPGRERAEIAKDYAGAIAACEAAVARDPENPRLRYQLARVLGYSGQGKLAMPHREKAIAGRYPQALFVNGFLYLTGQNENPQDVCKAGELMRESAIEERLAGLLGFPRYAMQGTFAGCTVKQDRAELLAFLDAARQQVAGDFYRTMLVDLLREDLLASKTIR